MFDHLLGWYTVYTFLGALPPNGILPGAKFTMRPGLGRCRKSFTMIFLGDHDIPLTDSNFGNPTAFRAIFSHIFIDTRTFSVDFCFG